MQLWHELHNNRPVFLSSRTDPWKANCIWAANLPFRSCSMLVCVTLQYTVDPLNLKAFLLCVLDRHLFVCLFLLFFLLVISLLVPSDRLNHTQKVLLCTRWYNSDRAYLAYDSNRAKLLLTPAMQMSSIQRAPLSSVCLPCLPTKRLWTWGP